MANATTPVIQINEGNVGIGTTTPLAKLDIQGTQGQLFSVTDDLSGSIFAVSDISGVPIFDVNSSGVSYFDGNVGIGATSPGAKLEVSTGAGANGDSVLIISADTDNSTNTSSPKLLMLQKGNTKTSLIEMDSSDRTNFQNSAGQYFSGGNVGIGTTSPTGKLDIFRTSLSYAVNRADTLNRAGLVIKSSGNFDSKITFSSGASSVQYIQALNNTATVGRDININPYGGNVITAGTMTATNFILSSDERLKENIEKACDNRIKADWKTFELKTDKGQKRYGVIAQELEKTNPEFVREDTQGFKSVAYIDLLIAKIAELEARLEKAGI